MHTYNRSVNAVTDFGNGQRRSVGSKYAGFLTDSIKLLKGGLLNFHILECCFYDKIAVSTKILFKTGSNLVNDCVSLLLSHFSFFNELCIALNDFVLAAFSPLLLNIAKSYFIAFCLSKCLGNALSHGAGTNNAYLHFISS